MFNKCLNLSTNIIFHLSTIFQIQAQKIHIPTRLVPLVQVNAPCAALNEPLAKQMLPRPVQLAFADEPSTTKLTRTNVKSAHWALIVPSKTASCFLNWLLCPAIGDQPQRAQFSPPATKAIVVLMPIRLPKKDVVLQKPASNWTFPMLPPMPNVFGGMLDHSVWCVHQITWALAVNV